MPRFQRYIIAVELRLNIYQPHVRIGVKRDLRVGGTGTNVKSQLPPAVKQNPKFDLMAQEMFAVTSALELTEFQAADQINPQVAKLDRAKRVIYLIDPHVKEPGATRLVDEQGEILTALNDAIEAAQGLMLIFCNPDFSAREGNQAIIDLFASGLQHARDTREIADLDELAQQPFNLGIRQMQDRARESAALDKSNRDFAIEERLHILGRMNLPRVLATIIILGKELAELVADPPGTTA